MLNVTVSGTTIRATDPANKTTSIETVGWDQPAPRTPLPFHADATVSGRATQLSFYGSGVDVGRVRHDGRIAERRQLDLGQAADLPDRRNLVEVNAGIGLTFRFDGPATVERTARTAGELAFSHPTPVTIGFHSIVSAPQHTVTVPSTPQGIATALSYFSATVADESPKRTSPNTRGHPPLIEYGESHSIPSPVERHAPDHGIELRLPPTLDALVPAAPLATYVGAQVVVDEAASPALRLPDHGRAREFSPVPALQFELAALLERVVFLDVLVRRAVEGMTDLRELDALSVLDLDVDRCFGAPLPDRLATYLDVDYDRVAAMFPDWHSIAYVEPTYENATVLPHLCRTLCQPFVPGRNSTPTDADPDREAPVGGTDPVRSPSPTGIDRPYVGWLGEGTLDGAYEIRPAAYEHRSRYLRPDDRQTSVAVVCNDPTRLGSRDRIADTYRGDEPIDVSVTVHDDLSRAELADLFADGPDVLHFVGDARDGLACSDGELSPDDLGDSSVRTFVLDGPAARETARDLIRVGSVAGVVRDGGGRDPPCDAAARADDDTVAPDGRPVRTYARLLKTGFTVDLACRLANRGAGSARLAAIGDGTAVLSVTDQIYTFPMRITPTGDRRFRVTVPTYVHDAGIVYVGDLLGEDVRSQFAGTPFDTLVDGSDLEGVLESWWTAVEYDGSIYLPGDFEPFYPLL